MTPVHGYKITRNAKSLLLARSFRSTLLLKTEKLAILVRNRTAVSSSLLFLRANPEPSLKVKLRSKKSTQLVPAQIVLFIIPR